ncbi:MAG: DUF2779 domain-containing protein [Alphaproteobacteria bacterium]|nr:DUF2779 domain-containing protein [Alphaproteobacteria bacterium]MBU0858321.1 DUF2779 domain-containing protein [Alphaproteobacteria bacterium]
MSDKPSLSKSQYVLGLQCTLALWNLRHGLPINPAPVANDDDEAAPDSKLLSVRDKTRAAGNDIGVLAQSYFTNGAAVTDDPKDTDACVASTAQLIAAGHDVIFEATAVNPADGGYAHIDALQRVPGTDEWDMIEVKSTTKAKAYHYDDIAYQYHVFTGAGYKIRNAYLMMVNEKFRKDGPVDPQKFFKLQNVTKAAKDRQAALQANITRINGAVDDPAKAPDEKIGSRCNNPHECSFKSKCWAGAPLYSIFNAYSGKAADAVYAKTGSLSIDQVPDEMLPDKEAKKNEMAAHRTGQDYIDRAALQGFLNKLEYPLYYLDYETAMSPVPMHDNTAPFQQVPFQFSLHIQEQPGSPLTHHAYIHKDASDPREAFAKELTRVCGDKGSVIVYYQSFEESRNKELAADLPHHAAALNAISARMVDLYVPFSNRWLYSPAQKGSVSIKKVLDAFTPLNYNSMNIPNGEVAQQRYMDFVNGVMTDPVEIAQLWTDLDDYCALDTKAMVIIVDDVLRAKVGQLPPAPPLPNPAL